MLPQYGRAQVLHNISCVKLERIQRCFTKCVRSLQNLSYEERLWRLIVPLLGYRRSFLLDCFICKLIHNLTDMLLLEVGLQLSTGRTRASGLKLLVPIKAILYFIYNSFIFK